MTLTAGAVRVVVRAITVIVPFALMIVVGAAWWAKGAAPPVRLDALGVTVEDVRVVRVADPEEGERRLERAAGRVAPGLDQGRLSLMDHAKARYVLGRIAVPARAAIPEGSHLFVAVAETDPMRTSSWTWTRGADSDSATVGWSPSLDDATAQVPWLSRRGSMPTASPSVVEVEPGDDLLMYAGLAEGTAARDADDVAIGLVWLGPSGRLWAHERLN